MPSVLYRLAKSQIAHPPGSIIEAVQYEVIMGSFAYGVSSDTSDVDVYGWCIPDKTTIFPHLKGEILGFGRHTQRFEQYQEHHLKDTSNNREYDISIYSIVKYFQLCMENNPNMIDSLFVPERCIVFSTPIGQKVRQNRRMFLHKGSFHKLKGYAYSQLSKLQSKTPSSSSKRRALIDKHGMDVKYAYHLVRLMNQAEQILLDRYY